MKRKINVFDYAKEIMLAVEKGVLLTTKSKGKVNTMSISWGTLGIEWNRPIFTAFVRESRFTKKLLDESGEFTVNIFLNNFDKQDENAIPKEIKEKNYPENVSGEFYGANRDYHTAYYGEIVSAYIIE